ncbi:MAG: saccharopine dehydrogenase NADP-binding domain-containing protein [Chitinophagaceae bacterium]|nr:saccharopine dehydrogenase NADP-binding domain-containing protein [Chitinophagaceae bacterium]
MDTILIFGAGKSSTVLIDYLIREAEQRQWKIIVADADLQVAKAKIRNSPFAEAMQLDIVNDEQRSKLIESAAVVISMMPPGMHYLVAKDCVHYKKHLLTASYVDDKIKTLQHQIESSNILFLCEMGLDPGIDHMSAMQIIDDIKANGGKITSFKSHCGGLVAPESDNNPWHYKISWNPRNVVLAGNSGAIFKQNGHNISIAYKDLFNKNNRVNINGIGALAYYANRDSLSYIPIYHLQEAVTFMRTTLRYAGYFDGWDAIVQAGLTSEKDKVAHNITFAEWSKSILPFITKENKDQLSFLGLFENDIIPGHIQSSADTLQYLLEKKLAMQPQDKDMIVMLHEFEYLENEKTKYLQSCLLVKGENNLQTAMAKTVGLPLGIAAKLILTGKLKLTGLHIPTLKEIYNPVLQQLEIEGIKFIESTM